MAVVERPRERVAREDRRVVLLLLEDGQELALDLAGLAPLEAGPAHDVGEHAEERVGVAREARRHHPHRVPVRRGVEGRAEVVDDLREGEGVARAGAAGHELGGEGREARLLEPLLRRAAPHGEAQGELGEPRVLEHDDLEAVRELGAVEPRRVDHGAGPDRGRRLLPGRRSLESAARREG